LPLFTSFPKLSSEFLLKRIFMAEPTIIEPVEGKTVFQKTLEEITQPFKDLMHASRALWGVNIAYFLEGLTYFGVLSLLALYFNEYVGLNDIDAGRMVGLLTGGITLSMLFLGATVDIIGVRKSLLLSLALMLVGRIFITISPAVFGSEGLWSSTHALSMFGILWIVLGYGIFQPACYAAVKRFTDVKTAAMGYAMLYALMNLGGFLPGLISPPVRKAFGMTGVFWVYIALTIVAITSVAIILTRKAVKEAEQGSIEKSDKEGGFKAFIATVKNQFIENRKKSFAALGIVGIMILLNLLKSAFTDGSSLTNAAAVFMYNNSWLVAVFITLGLFIWIITDARFVFFVFMLIPVQTLFAHNWLTLPQYTNRAFTGVVSENFEFFVNFNPLLIFILAPMVAALTIKKDTYKMMILGTFVMAAPTFILVLGPNIFTLFGYLVIMTIGEAMWQPRFLQWIAEIAPKGMTGIYMGIGQFPWFLTKIITSLYSGWFLMQYCPEGVAPENMNTETMWLIYGFIAIASPIGLLLARKWMMKGFKTTAAS
jgi:proton-dependent oligopeptide transporter, POT family